METFKAIYDAGGADFFNHRLVANPDYQSASYPGSTVENGRFETGTLERWTTSGGYAAIVYQPGWGGSYVAQVGSTTSSLLDSAVEQTFTVPPAGVKSLQFYYQVKCFDFGVQYDQFWVTLRDNDTSTTYTIVPQTCSNSGKWVLAEHALTSVVGHSVTLKFHTHDDGVGNYPTYAWFDQVRLTPVGNASFETATLSSWTSTGDTGVSTHPAGTPEQLGEKGARVGSTEPYTDSSLSQTFTVPTFGADTLAFDVKVVCEDTITYDWVFATLRDNVTGTTYTIMPNTCTNTGLWETKTFDLRPVLGHSVTLTFNAHDDNHPGDPTYGIFDNVLLR